VVHLPAELGALGVGRRRGRGPDRRRPDQPAHPQALLADAKAIFACCSKSTNGRYGVKTARASA
jgi:hypothetical protein